jgi:hypothetical protein
VTTPAPLSARVFVAALVNALCVVLGGVDYALARVVFGCPRLEAVGVGLAGVVAFALVVVVTEVRA